MTITQLLCRLANNQYFVRQTHAAYWDREYKILDGTLRITYDKWQGVEYSPDISIAYIDDDIFVCTDLYPASHGDILIDGTSCKYALSKEICHNHSEYADEKLVKLALIV